MASLFYDTELLVSYVSIAQTLPCGVLPCGGSRLAHYATAHPRPPSPPPAQVSVGDYKFCDHFLDEWVVGGATGRDDGQKTRKWPADKMASMCARVQLRGPDVAVVT